MGDRKLEKITYDEMPERAAPSGAALFSLKLRLYYRFLDLPYA